MCDVTKSLSCCMKAYCSTFESIPLNRLPNAGNRLQTRYLKKDLYFPLRLQFASQHYTRWLYAKEQAMQRIMAKQSQTVQIRNAALNCLEHIRKLQTKLDSAAPAVSPEIVQIQDLHAPFQFSLPENPDEELLKHSISSVRPSENENVPLHTLKQSIPEHDASFNSLYRQYGTQLGKEVDPHPLRRLIIGEPSCGKTQLVQHLAYSYAYAWLDAHRELADETFPDTDPETAQALLETVYEQQDDFRNKPNMIPIMITGGFVDKLLADEARAQQVHSLEDLLYAALCDISPDEQPERQAFSRMLQKLASGEHPEGKLLLIEDAIDEIFHVQHAKFFLQLTDEFLQKHPQVEFIATGRALFFNRRAQDEASIEIQDGFHKLHCMQYRISELNDQDILDFAHRWYRIVESMPEDEITEKLQRIRVWEKHIQLTQKFLRIPMYLSMTLIVISERGTEPGNRSELFENLMEIMLKAQPKTKPETGSISGQTDSNPLRSYEETLWLISYLACSMTQKGRRSITLDELTDIFAQGLHELHQEIHTDLSKKDIYQLEMFLIRRACVLAGSENFESFSFTHLQIQEYLTALCIKLNMTGSLYQEYQTGQEILVQNIQESRYREIIKFAVCCSSSEAPFYFIYPLVNQLIAYAEQVDDDDIWTFLFELVTQDATMQRSQIEVICRNCFRIKISPSTLRYLMEYLKIGGRNKISDYIMHSFRESCQTEDTEFVYAASCIAIVEYIQECEKAGADNDLGILVDRLMQSSTVEEQTLSAFIIETYQWLLKLPRHIPFKLPPCTTGLDTARRCAAFLQGDDKRLHRPMSGAFSAIVQQDKHIADQCLTDELFLSLLERLKQDPDDSSAKQIVTIYPINPHTLTLHHRIAGLEPLRSLSVQRWENREQDPERAVYNFILSVFLGAWDLDGALSEQFSILLPFETEDFDDELRKKRVIREWLSTTLEPRQLISDGFAAYLKGEYLKAAEHFLLVLSLSSEPDSSSVNLAYMLRRHEIPELWMNGIRQTVPGLLEGPLRECDPFALVNMALYLAEQQNEPEAGLAYLRENKQTAETLHYVRAWWENLQYEQEGALGMEWLRGPGESQT